MLGLADIDFDAKENTMKKLEIEKEWCMRMAQVEGDAEIGAGRLAIDPTFDGEAVPAVADDEAGPGVCPRRTRSITA